MVIVANFFERVENLEPHCPGCGGKVSFGVTTEYKSNLGTHACRTCGHTF